VNTALYLAKRLALSKQPTLSRLIIRLATAATALSVMVMIVGLSAFNGFTKTISNKIFAFSGHVHIINREADRIVTSEETVISKNDSIIKALQASIPSIETVKPYITKSAILQSKKSIEGALLKGLFNNQGNQSLTGFMQAGSFIQFADSGYSKNLVLPVYLANALEVTIGDTIFLYIIKPDGTQNKRKLTVAGIYKTGIEDYDKHQVLCDAALIQKLINETSDKISGYELHLKNYVLQDTVVSMLFEHPAFPINWDAKTIRQVNPQIFDWLALQSQTKYMLIAIMLIVAALNIITCLLVLVVERVRMIGLLTAVGQTHFNTQKIFVYHALYISAIGIGIGLLLGLAICWLQQRFGFIKLPEESYFIDKVAIDLNGWQVALICLGTLAINFLILFIPSILVKKINTVKALQFK
jgi:lipoprotein-releasing system permease protein